jgi:hypothetical protein
MRFRSCNGPNPLPSFVTTHSHKIISPRDCREIKGIERFKFIFILAQNWLAYFFVEIHDSEEPHSQASLHQHTKKRPKLFDRVYLCSELINESRKLLRELSDKFVEKFEIPRLVKGLNLCNWENAVVIREFNGWIFPKSTKAVIAFCLFTGMSKAFMDRNILSREANSQQSSKSSDQSTKKIAKVTPSKNRNWRTNSIIDDEDEPNEEDVAKKGGVTSEDGDDNMKPCEKEQEGSDAGDAGDEKDGPKKIFKACL